ncbi:MAG: NrdH-redoxin [Candidatus Harrisonbacteria bacterium RIFCSPHIGHO2_02_FULL_40_20]|nr:MAG: NrdH-redoxin [Candidatus Harrisonbacteria bacterium RIFCSPHIGHO2_02_FULL_40_20]
MKSVKIYSTPTCVYCKMAKDFFQTHNITYQEFNVAENDQARDEMVEKSHQLGVPVIDIDGEILVGFNRSELERVLGLTK